MTDPVVTGVLLAAGAGSRMGLPKALVVGADGAPWLTRAIRTLRDGGCADVVVVLGASADRASALIAEEPAVRAVIAEDWADGIAASLRRGLRAIASGSGRAPADAALVSLVDLPGMPAAAVTRLQHGAARDSLRQATYDGRPGHPVLIGADHWPSLVRGLVGDRGAGAYLREHGALRVPCEDLWDGSDIDRV